MKIPTWLSVVIVLAFVGLAAYGAWQNSNRSSVSVGDNFQDKDINSFEDCAAAGYPIQESYPEQCTTSDGRHFTRVIPPTSSGQVIIN